MIISAIAVLTSVYAKVAAVELAAYQYVKKHLAVSNIKSEIAKIETEAVTDAKAVVTRIKTYL